MGHLLRGVAYPTDQDFRRANTRILRAKTVGPQRVDDTHGSDARHVGVLILVLLVLAPSEKPRDSSEEAFVFFLLFSLVLHSRHMLE